MRTECLWQKLQSVVTDFLKFHTHIHGKKERTLQCLMQWYQHALLFFFLLLLSLCIVLSCFLPLPRSLLLSLSFPIFHFFQCAHVTCTQHPNKKNLSSAETNICAAASPNSHPIYLPPSIHACARYTNHAGQMSWKMQMKKTCRDLLE